MKKKLLLLLLLTANAHSPLLTGIASMLNGEQQACQGAGAEGVSVSVN